MANIAYITKDSTKEEIYKAYIDTQKKLKATVFHKKEIQGKVAEVRKEKNKRYSELRYQLLKKEQRIFRLKQHIQNLQRFAVNERHKAKKKGIEIGRGKVRKVDYSVIKMYEFLLQVDQVSSILGLKLNYCAFILWAGRYEFFNFKDFKKDLPNHNKSIHFYVTKFLRSGHVIQVHTDNVMKQYALTGTGIDLFNKIDKFTKKHFNE
jgi:virulence-associated protein VapD